MDDVCKMRLYMYIMFFDSVDVTKENSSKIKLNFNSSVTRCSAPERPAAGCDRCLIRCKIRNNVIRIQARVRFVA